MKRLSLDQLEQDFIEQEKSKTKGKSKPRKANKDAKKKASSPSSKKASSTKTSSSEKQGSNPSSKIKVIKFNSRSENQFRVFSNFFPSPMVINDTLYSCVEQYYQAAKLDEDDSSENISKIMDSLDPFKMKYFGSAKSGAKERPDIDDLKDRIMYNGLKAKFTQNPILQEILLETGDAELIEEAPWDEYWGSGKTGEGQNKMGSLLMKVRKGLRKGKIASIYVKSE